MKQNSKTTAAIRWVEWVRDSSSRISKKEEKEKKKIKLLSANVPPERFVCVAFE